MQTSRPSALDDRIVRDGLGVTFAETRLLDMQFEAIDRLCEAYNDRVTLSEMRFYPKGGSLYRLFWRIDSVDKTGVWYDDDQAPSCYNTGDVDGWLVVVPRGLKNRSLANYFTSTVREIPSASKDTSWGFTQVEVNDLYRMVEEAFARVFNKTAAAAWLSDASISGEFTLSLPPKAFDVQEEAEDNFVNPRSQNKSTFERVPVYNEADYDPGLVDSDNLLKPSLGLKLSTPGSPPIAVDAHFGFLQPICTGEKMTRMVDAMYNAKRLLGVGNVFLMEKTQFFTDQLRLMFERLYDYFALAVLDKDTSSKWMLGRISQKDETVLFAVSKLQGVLKAAKTLDRVEKFSTDFERMTLNDLYHRRDHVYGDTIMRWAGIQYSQCHLLRKKVGMFNALILSGLNTLTFEHKYYNYPRPSTPDNTGRIFCLSLAKRNRLICDDMTVHQIVRVVRRMFDNAKRVGTASMARAGLHAEHFAWCFQDAMQYKRNLIPPEAYANLRF